jgi:hypothetical protein
VAVSALQWRGRWGAAQRRYAAPPAWPGRVAALAAVAAGILASLAAPTRAFALLPGLPGLPGIDDAAGEIIKKGFSFIVEALFGGEAAAELTTGLVRWLVTIPNLSAGSVAQMEGTVAAIALGSFAAIMTFAALRYYVAGLAGGDGFEPLQAIGRGIVAGIAIAIWPFLFDALSRLGSAISGALLSSSSLKSSLADLLGTGLGGMPDLGDGLPFILGIVIAVAGIVAVLCLVVVKILISALTVVIYLAAPLAFAAWVIPELSWIAGMLMKVLAGLLAVPVIWTLIFLAFAAISRDTLLAEPTAEGAGIGGNLADAAIVKPMVALALLYMTIVGPRWLLARIPVLGGGGGGGLVPNVAIPYAVSAGFSRMGSAGAGSARQPAPAMSQPREGAGGAAGTTGAAGAGAAAAALGGAAAAKSAPASAGAAGGAPGTRGLAAASAIQPAAAQTGNRASAATPTRQAYPTDSYGGPRVAMDEQRRDAVVRDLQAMRRGTGAARPGPAEVRAAFESLPAQLQGASAAARQTATQEEARMASARWLQHPSSEPHRQALLTIGSASEKAWREGVPDLPRSASVLSPGPAERGTGNGKATAQLPLEDERADVDPRTPVSTPADPAPTATGEIAAPSGRETPSSRRRDDRPSPGVPVDGARKAPPAPRRGREGQR